MADKDVVVVFTAGGLDRGEIAPLLVSALRSDRSLKENPDAYGRLQERVVVAAKPRTPSLYRLAWNRPQDLREDV